MESFFKEYSYLFPVFFICLWGLACKLLAVLGGWSALAEKYSAIEAFDGITWHMQSASIGVVNYSGCLTVGASSTSLYISVMLPFRFGQPPLLIPLSDVDGKEEKRWFFRYVKLAIGKPSVAHMRISKGLADRIMEVSKGAWKYDAIEGRVAINPPN
jgi:hypothetical protein